MNDSIQVISIDLLDAHPSNPRLYMRDEVIESITNQILDGNGKFDAAHALLVRPLNGHYQVIDGHHRMIAAQRAGLSEIPCWVREMTDEDAYMQMGLVNYAQDRLSGLELGIHAFFSVEPGEKGRGKKGGIREYARLMGVSHEHVRNMRNAAEVYISIAWHYAQVEMDKMSSQLTFYSVDLLPSKCPKCKKDLLPIILGDKNLCIVFDEYAVMCWDCRFVLSAGLDGHMFINYNFWMPLNRGVHFTDDPFDVVIGNKAGAEQEAADE